MTTFLNTYFEKSYCINLDKRPDRWLKTEELLKSCNIECERFSGFDGKTLNLRRPYCSELGGAISHLNVIKHAMDSNLKNVLIFEDDVIFDTDIDSKFKEYVKFLPEDWDILYFGGNHSDGKPIQVNEHIYKLTRTYALQLYAVNSKAYDKIINFLQKNINEVLLHNKVFTPSVAADYFMAELQKDLNCYIFNPHLAFQREDFSDIQDKVVNYDYLLKNNL